MRDEMGDLERRFDALGDFAGGRQSVLRESHEQTAEDARILGELERHFPALGGGAESVQRPVAAEEVVGEEERREAVQSMQG